MFEIVVYKMGKKKVKKKVKYVANLPRNENLKMAGRKLRAGPTPWIKFW